MSQIKRDMMQQEFYNNLSIIHDINLLISAKKQTMEALIQRNIDLQEAMDKDRYRRSNK